jgi:hypothetical protein
MDAKSEGVSALLESMHGFDYRCAVNSTAERPFAAYAKENILHKIRTYLAILAKDFFGELPIGDEPVDVDDEGMGDEGDLKKPRGSRLRFVDAEHQSPGRFSFESNQQGYPYDDIPPDAEIAQTEVDVDTTAIDRATQLENALRLTPLEVEVLEATSASEASKRLGGKRKDRRSYSQIGLDLQYMFPDAFRLIKFPDKKVSRIRQIALYKAQRYWSSPRDPRAYYESIPSVVLRELCVVERIVFASRFMQNKTREAVIDELACQPHDSLRCCGKCKKKNLESTRLCTFCGTSMVLCPSCKTDHLSTKSPKQIVTIQNRTVRTLKKHGIEVPTFR